MPFNARFPEKLEKEQTIVLKGVFTANADQIAINFQTKNMEVIAFHFNIRFGSGAVFMSSAPYWINSYTAAWGAEESKANPFRRGDPFDIRFRIHENHFQILVNQMDFYNYKYRVALSSITHLAVGGNGYLTFAQLGEKYNPVPYSSTLSIPSDDKSSEGEQNTTVRWAMPYLAPMSKLETGQTIIVKGVFFADVDQYLFSSQNLITS